MNINPQCLAAFILLSLMSQHGHAAEMPARDPFVKPAMDNITTAAPAPQETKPELELRALLVAGAASIANVGGTMLAIGDEIDGYRLMSVSQGEAMFQKGAKQYRIPLREQEPLP